MRMTYKNWVCLSVVIYLSGCGSMQESRKTEELANDSRECAKNFTVEGSSLSATGNTYKTHVTVPSVSRKVAIDKASKHIASEGLTITTIDREGGMIVASNRVTGGRGGTVPLVVTFEEAKAGLKVNMRFTTGFGHLTSADMLRDKLCNIVDAIQKK